MTLLQRLTKIDGAVINLSYMIHAYNVVLLNKSYIYAKMETASELVESSDLALIYKLESVLHGKGIICNNPDKHPWVQYETAAVF